MHGESSSDPENRYGELLAEPIIQLAMKADGVEEAALRATPSGQHSQDAHGD